MANLVKAEGRVAELPLNPLDRAKEEILKVLSERKWDCKEWERFVVDWETGRYLKKWLKGYWMRQRRYGEVQLLMDTELAVYCLYVKPN
jgi:hypothetical protein